MKVIRAYPGKELLENGFIRNKETTIQMYTVPIHGVIPMYSTFTLKDEKIVAETNATKSVVKNMEFESTKEIRKFYRNYWPGGKPFVMKRTFPVVIEASIISSALNQPSYYDNPSSYIQRKGNLTVIRRSTSTFFAREIEGKYYVTTIPGTMPEDYGIPIEVPGKYVLLEQGYSFFEKRGDVIYIQTNIHTGEALVANRRGVFIVRNWKKPNDISKSNLMSTFVVIPFEMTPVKATTSYVVFHHEETGAMFQVDIHKHYEAREVSLKLENTKEIVEEFGEILL